MTAATTSPFLIDEVLVCGNVNPPTTSKAAVTANMNIPSFRLDHYNASPKMVRTERGIDEAELGEEAIMAMMLQPVPPTTVATQAPATAVAVPASFYAPFPSGFDSGVWTSSKTAFSFEIAPSTTPPPLSPSSPFEEQKQDNDDELMRCAWNKKAETAIKKKIKVAANNIKHNKKGARYPPLYIVIMSSTDYNDDDVSMLYDDPDVDDEDCLPPATIDVLYKFLEDIEDDFLGEDESDDGEDDDNEGEEDDDSSSYDGVFAGK